MAPYDTVSFYQTCNFCKSFNCKQYFVCSWSISMASPVFASLRWRHLAKTSSDRCGQNISNMQNILEERVKYEMNFITFLTWFLSSFQKFVIPHDITNQASIHYQIWIFIKSQYSTYSTNRISYCICWLHIARLY